MHVKLNTISILLIIVSMLVCITTIMLYSALDENLMINRISRGYYGDHAVHFKFASEERGVKETIKLLKDSKYKDVALIYDDHESALRQIYIKGRYVEPPMLSGRFLKESDFFKNQRLAVVGKGSLKDTYIENSQRYIFIDGKKFQVIGVMGYKSDTILDSMKVVNMDSLMRNFSNEKYIIDSYSDNIGIKFQENINQTKEMFKAKNIQIEILDVSPIGANRLLRTNINTSLVFILLVMCFLLCNYNIATTWLDHYTEAIGIMNLVGWTSSNIKHYIYTRFLLYSIIGVVLGLISSFMFGIEIKRNLIIFYTLLFNILLSFLSIVPILNKVIKMPIAEVIK